MSFWSGKLPIISIFNLIGRKTRCRALGFVLCGFTLARLPAFATGSVTLAWNKCADPCVAGYNIYYGGSSCNYTNEFFAGNLTNATIPGLVEGTTYYFAATTYTSSGMESPFSCEVSFTVINSGIFTVKAVISNSIPASVIVTATGSVPSCWALQSSQDLKIWTTVAQGTNVPVNVSVAAGSLPMQFFRLLSQ